jgi:hypothetical protein
MALSQYVGRVSIPDSSCANVSGMETRPADLSLPGLIEKLLRIELRQRSHNGVASKVCVFRRPKGVSYGSPGLDGAGKSEGATEMDKHRGAPFFMASGTTITVDVN